MNGMDQIEWWVLDLKKGKWELNGRLAGGEVRTVVLDPLQVEMVRAFVVAALEESDHADV